MRRARTATLGTGDGIGCHLLDRIEPMDRLCATSPVGIVAVPYRAGVADLPIRLPDGAMVESPTPEQRANLPTFCPSFLNVGTLHCLNLADAFVIPNHALPVALIYGCRAESDPAR